MTNRESFLNELELAGISEREFYETALSVLISRLKEWRKITYEEDDIYGIEHYDKLIAAATYRRDF